MKKLIAILIMAFVPMLASAQVQLYTTGVTHGIQSSNAAAALGDSVHTIGFVSMRNGTQFADSIQIWCESSDSLNIRYFVVPVEDLGTETVADSTAGCGFVQNVATGGYKFTAGTYGLVPWLNIVAGITQLKTGAKGYRIYARVYAVGSELRGNSKTFKTIVRRFF